MSSTLITVYKTRHSPFTVTIFDPITKLAFSETQINAITRAILKYTPSSGATPEYADSNAAGHEDVFTFNDAVAAQGRIVIDVGFINFTAGTDTAAELIIFTSNYPSGFVATTLNLTISEDALDNATLADSTTIIPLNCTDNIVLTSTYFRHPIIMNAAVTKSIELPNMGANDDGEWFDIIKAGAGQVDVSDPNGYAIGAAGNTILSLKGTGWVHRRIQYIHAITAWIVHGYGSIA